MFWLLFNCFIISVFLWIYIKWTKVKRYWSDRGVSYVPPFFFLGNLTFLQRENPGIWMRRLYEKYKEPYVGVWWFWRPALVINSPEIARNVLVKDFSVFRNRFVSSGTSDPIGGLNLFTVNDPLWSRIRRRVTSIFSAAKLRSLQQLLNTKSKELIQRINNEKDKTKISLKMVFTDYTTDIVGRAVFGIDGDATLTGKGPIRTVTNSFMKFDFYRGLCFSSIFFWPELVDIFGFSFFPKTTGEYFKKIIRLVSEQRKDMKDEPKDLIGALLKLKDAGGTEDLQISEDIIVAQAAIFLFGGFDTSGSSLTFIVYELAFHSKAQENIYNEIKETHADETDDLDSSKLAEVKYLNSAIKETLRLFPGMGWIDRIATVDYKVDDNLTIPAGTPVYVNGNGIHYDPEYYPNPEVFDPDRFLPENEKEMIPFTYMPFGEGPRSCIGKRFGLMSMRHALARLVLNYRFEPLPGAPKPNEVEIEKQGVFYFPGEHLYINFIPRE